MEINEEEIKKRAEKIDKEGFDEKVLNEATKLYGLSINKAENALGRKVLKSADSLSTHITSEDIAYFMEIFGNKDFSKMKALDLGCGMPFRLLPGYAPIFSIAMNELGVQTYAVDMYGDSEAMKSLGINFEKNNLVFSDILSQNKSEFVEENDFISARSFLGGGFYGPDGENFGYGIKAWDIYSELINNFREMNKKEAVYELDTPDNETVKDYIGETLMEKNKSFKNKKIREMENDLIKKSFGNDSINPNRSGAIKPYVILKRK